MRDFSKELIVKTSVSTTVNGTNIFIPEDATNGDVIKAVFPKSKTVQLTNMTIAVWYEVIGDCGKWVNYQIDWWNAKYKGGE